MTVDSLIFPLHNALKLNARDRALVYLDKLNPVIR